MTRTTVTCDAGGAHLDLIDDHLRHWGGTAPDGRTIGANNYHLTLDGEPWPIVAGEFHPQRYPRAEWAEVVRALRASGCTMVSSYWFWNLVEPEPGRFDFGGGNDIAAFARICADHGMWFAPRIGPFNNAEFLLGGLPPWLYGMPVTERSNDPRYLDLVGRYYAAIGDQLRGLLWQHGGPIAIVQLENELSHAPNHWSTLFGYTATDHRGPVGAEFTRHMAELRRLAIEAGIAAPIFSMTGWSTAGDLPDDDFLPSYGGYFDLHPRPGRNFRLTTFGGQTYPYRGRLPIAFSELGTGSPGRAAYRPMSPPEMVITTALTRLAGAESIFLGYYLAHGGSNPTRGDGFGWMTKEPTFGLRSYDFWAPISEYGERRASFYRAAPLNLFVREFGADLARMAAVEVDDPVEDPDEDRLRAVVRADDHGGFVFLSNYGNNTPLSDRDDVTLRVTLARGEVNFPRRSTLSVPSAGWAILPINLDLGLGLTLVSSTAQPLARLGTAERPTLVSFAPTDGAVEYVVSDGAESRVLIASGPGTSEIPTASGPVQLITLDRRSAERAQLIARGEDRRLIISDDELTETPDGLRVSRFVPFDDPELPPAGVRLLPGNERREGWLPEPKLHTEDVQVERLSESRWVLRVEPGMITDPDDLWIDLDYTGDLCRAFDAGSGQLLADNFNQGIPWRIKLGRFADALTGSGVQFRAEPYVRSADHDATPEMLLDSNETVLAPAVINAVRPFARQSVVL